MSTSQSSLPAALAAGKTTSAPGDLRRLAGPLLALPVTAWLLLAFAAPFVTCLLYTSDAADD